MRRALLLLVLVAGCGRDHEPMPSPTPEPLSSADVRACQAVRSALEASPPASEAGQIARAELVADTVAGASHPYLTTQAAALRAWLEERDGAGFAGTLEDVATWCAGDAG